MNANNLRNVASAFLTVLFLFLPGFSSMAKSLKSLTICQNIQLNDAILGPGEYRVEILQNAGTTEVAIYKGKSLIVKAPAQAAQQSKKVQRTSVLYLLNGDDTPQMTELRLAGELVTYQFNSASQLTKKKSSKNT